MSNRIIVTNFDYKTKMQCHICGQIDILYFICAEYDDRSKTAMHMCKDCCEELAEKITKSLEGVNVEITKLDRASNGIDCFSCTSKKDVLALGFRRDGHTAGNTVFLCAECRAELAIELFKSLGAFRRSRRL